MGQSLSHSPPVADKVEHVMEMFGDVRVDNYYWLRDDSRSHPDVLSYLEQENEYTDSFMAGAEELEDQLYDEIMERFPWGDSSVPRRIGPYYYYEKSSKGKEYALHCRRPVPKSDNPPSVNDVMPTGPDAPPEHVILDENVEAQNHAYYNIDAFKVSPNSKLLAYAEDTKGDEICTAHVIDAETQSPVGKPLVGVTSDLEWAGDEALVYITKDEIHRPDKAWLHRLGTEQSSDHCLYHAKDDTFSLDLCASESNKYLFIASASRTTRFNFHLDVSKPEDGINVLTPRVYGVDTSVSHRGNHFYIKRRSDEFFNSEVIACPVDNTSACTVLLPHIERYKFAPRPSRQKWTYHPIHSQVKAQNYPNIHVTAGLNDPHILYSEPAKFVAKLREMKTDDNVVLFNCKFEGGHFPNSWRSQVEEDAFIYAFILKALNMIPAPRLRFLWLFSNYIMRKSRFTS